MSEWWTYRPQDFLLFSERVYWRLFELHNDAIWPAQFVALFLGVVIVYLVLQSNQLTCRIIASILAAAWVFVAWAFFWETYATINWAAPFVAPIFLAEALFLFWIGVVRSRLDFTLRKDSNSVIGMALFFYALILVPFLSLIGGRPIEAAEVFGITADPTAIGTIGLLGIANSNRSVWLLYMVPLIWCAVSWATLFTMGAWEAWSPLAAIVLTVATRFWIDKRPSNTEA